MVSHSLCTRPRQGFGRPFLAIVVISLASLTLVSVTEPLSADRQSASVDSPVSQTFQEGQVLEARTGRPIAVEDWITDLASRDVIYLGEEHRNRSHVEAALRILRGLLAKGRRPA
ncbi:MAG: hypothetical protein AABZ22_04955, partial [Nitrospirota bacterium]